MDPKKVRELGRQLFPGPGGPFAYVKFLVPTKIVTYICGSPPGVMMADTLSFNAKIGVVDF